MSPLRLPLPDPQPLDTRQALRVVARLARVLERTDAELSLSQYRMLAMVARRSARSSRLAAELSLTRPTVSVALEGLEEQGLVTRRPDPDDRRATRVELTDAGRQALQTSEEAWVVRITPLIEGCSDPHTLLTLLGEVEAHMDRVREQRLAERQRKAPEGR
jgi:DNA-binding MarR family transcriptional regulator